MAPPKTDAEMTEVLKRQATWFNDQEAKKKQAAATGMMQSEQQPPPIIQHNKIPITSGDYDSNARLPPLGSEMNQASKPSDPLSLSPAWANNGMSPASKPADATMDPDQAAA